MYRLLDLTIGEIDEARVLDKELASYYNQILKENDELFIWVINQLPAKSGNTN